ncbi:MAG: HD domain-containing protein [Bacteroidia bacterium]
MKSTLSKIEWEDVYAQVVSMLETKLPDICEYHSLEHTLDVLVTAESIAAKENLLPEEIQLLKIAALFHDTGFATSLSDHEQNSCEIAINFLQKYNLSIDSIEIIKSAIMATKIPQNPKSKLEQVLCDADLDYLGRSDFYSIGETLFKELSNQGILKNRTEWNQLQVKFLSNHEYFTNSSKLTRKPQKLLHLKEIKDWLTNKE